MDLAIQGDPVSSVQAPLYREPVVVRERAPARLSVPHGNLLSQRGPHRPQGKGRTPSGVRVKLLWELSFSERLQVKTLLMRIQLTNP